MYLITKSQGRKRKTLLSYFSTSDVSPAITPNVTATSNATPSANITPSANHGATTTPSAAPIYIHDPPGAPTATTITLSAPPTVTTSPIDPASLERDPGLRRPIWMYLPNVRDDIRREYIRLGACQPKLKKDQYPSTEFGNQRRRFQASWVNSWRWLEIQFRKMQHSVFRVFYLKRTHLHNMQLLLMDLRIGKELMITRDVINRQSLEEIKKNRLRLRATIEAVRYLSLQACALRGHDELSTSRNRGNLIEMIKVFGRLSLDISNVVLEKAPKNAMYTSPKVHKDILHILATKVRNKIRDEFGDSKYCILVDEVIDASYKEQMAIVLQFVDVHGFIRERFFDIVNVADTISSTLKKEISYVLTRNNLNIHNMRGQGYDGVSNMRGAFNGLQALFLKDCPYAYYVHCFSHRLQLALAAHDIEVETSVASGERETCRGLNQIGNLQRSGTTRWSSHFKYVCSLMDKFGSIIVVLENITNCTTSSNSMRGEARGSLKALKSFDFLFVLHLMHKIMGITDLLCRALQSKSIDILNAMDSVATII
ncbi:uncharacterized protein LOC141711835 [Apium graveolens]|uniref:uncharacterized protein LOC141711835 n=1 Tax=Apium graveolens TaxID=4045 RepID=UPI003D79E3CF